MNNIMQVRSSLQNKKQQNNTKIKPFQSVLEFRESARHRKQTTDRSQTKSTHEKKDLLRTKKTNQKNKDKENKDCKTNRTNTQKDFKDSRNLQRVSPIKNSSRKMKSKSPLQNDYIGRKMNVSPIKEEEKFEKKQFAVHTISTKMNTERTPLKKIETAKAKQKSVKKPKQSKGVNSKKKQKQRKIGANRSKEKLKIEKEGKNRSPYDKSKSLSKSRSKSKSNEKKQSTRTFFEQQNKKKKFVPQINTKGPQRKESYFDRDIFEKLNLDNLQFFRRKRKNQQQQYQTDFQHKNLELATYRQFGTLTEQNFYNEKGTAAYRELQSFRKEQQLKWRIMYLQLNQLKKTVTPQKIQQILQESQRNISQFQSKSKQISNRETKYYIIENPIKVKQLLSRKRNSQDSKSIIKSISQKRLLQQLESFNNLEEISQNRSIVKQEKPSVSSFCVEFEKQLENYCQENQQKSKTPYLSIQIEHIPELQYKKSKQVSDRVEDWILLQFAHEIVSYQAIFHAFLKSKKEIILHEENQMQKQMPKIKSDSTYCQDLIYKLFVFIQNNGISQTLLRRANQPFGSTPLQNLKILRNSIQNEQTQQASDDIGNEIVIDSDTLCLFESQNYTGPIEDQYYFNHCVYSSLNEVFDMLRPYSPHGRPPLLTKVKPIHKSLGGLFSMATKNLEKLLKVKMGREQLGLQQLDVVKITQNSYYLMDSFFIKELEEKFGIPPQYLIEEKYYLAEFVINDIFNDQIMMIYNEFI